MGAALRVAITGSSGFIGKHLVRRLLKDGHEVVEIDLVNGVDVRHTDVIEVMFRGCDCVVHLAAKNGATAQFYDLPIPVLDVGVKSALSVVEAAQIAGVPDLIVMSSSEVYGNPEIVPTPETCPIRIPDITNPRYSYAIGKIVTEAAAMYAPGFRKVQIATPFNVYGAGQRPGHVVTDFVRQIKSGRVVVQGVGLETRSFTHIDDIIDGMMVMYEKGGPGKYHIGSPRETRIVDLLSMLCVVMERYPEVEYGPAAAGSPSRRCPDITKMRELGWTPHVTLLDGLKRLTADR